MREAVEGHMQNTMGISEARKKFNTLDQELVETPQ